MPTRSSTRLALLAILAGGSYALPARAVITIGPRSIVSSADYLVGGRAQYIGRWGAFIGTPIGPRHFVTANHVGNGGGGGQFFFHNGTATESNYTATFVANQDDLAVWRIADTDPSFTLWAPLYTASNETGLPLTAIGRGTDKGAEVRLPQTTGELRGWTWGASDGQVSGGTNVVTSIFTYVGAPAGFGGDYLYFEFDQNAGPTECIYSVGDSGGAVFIQDPADSVTKLAGINSLVDGNFSYTQSGTYFPAAIFDARGFWVGSSSADGTYIDPANYPNPVPAASYATRISSRLAFLRSIVPACGSADFNCDGDIGTDADIEAFFACLAGSCPASPCRSTADFNGDGDVGTDADIEAFFRVLAGGSC